MTIAAEIIARRLSFGEWETLFSGLTLGEFNDILHAAIHSGNEIELTLLCALARKLHEHGHFSDGLDQSERTALIAKADTIMAFALSKSDAARRATLEAA